MHRSLTVFKQNKQTKIHEQVRRACVIQTKNKQTEEQMEVNWNVVSRNLGEEKALSSHVSPCKH